MDEHSFRVPHDPAIVARTKALVAAGEALLDEAMVDLDALDPDPADRDAAKTEGRPIKRLWPDVKGAWPVSPRHHGKWFASSLALMSSVCGDGHEFPSTYFWLVEGGTRGGVVRGLGVLEAFLESYESTIIWKTDKKPNIQEIPRTIATAGGGD
jgi:hypothetical protein